MMRTEYPRPDFIRDEWMSLNGSWDFRFGDEVDWRVIQVPFVYQCKASGIGDDRICDKVFYRRYVQVPEIWRGRRVYLNFGAFDYECRVCVNDHIVGAHVGGNVGFSIDITDVLNWKDEKIEVEVFDPTRDETIPRGKQAWTDQPDSIWYTRSTGIWQSVWMEPVSETHIKRLMFTPDIDRGVVEIEYECEGIVDPSELVLEINMKGVNVQKLKLSIPASEGVLSLDIFQYQIFRSAFHDTGWCWSPEHPNLFDVEASVMSNGSVTDSVKTYFGMRKIEAKNGMVYLNNRPYYQKLVLDQGYWENSLMTAESDDDYRKDIELAKKMGFNGCRKHQKTEDPRFLYWADHMGYLVWGEVGASVCYSRKAAKRFIDEWHDAVLRDYNHPSIIVWTLINESWGVPGISNCPEQQSHSLALYHHVKSMDQTRLLIGNDGWEITKSDICTIHNYRHGSSEETQKQSAFFESLSNRENLLRAEPAGRRIFAEGYRYLGEPIILSEFGGISIDHKNSHEWGYSLVNDGEGLLEAYSGLIDAIEASDAICGYCYTQLTDVEQETNGLLTKSRAPKADVESVKKLNDRITEFRLMN